jgi:hypothetical protein
MAEGYKYPRPLPKRQRGGLRERIEQALLAEIESLRADEVLRRLDGDAV